MHNWDSEETWFIYVRLSQQGRLGMVPVSSSHWMSLDWSPVHYMATWKHTAIKTPIKKILDLFHSLNVNGESTSLTGRFIHL